MNSQKLILINGFAGAGKSTIAKLYIDEHPLALRIEGDEPLANIGQWSRNEPKALELMFELVKSMASTHLRSGHDVVLPYFVRDAQHAEAFEQLAVEADADFYEFVLHNDHEDAVARLLKRGTWGEAGQPSISKDELPEINRLVTLMEKELKKRPDVIAINISNDPAVTYAKLKTHL